CYAGAKAIGVEAPTYRTFLEKLYGTADVLTARQLQEQGRTLDRAGRQPKYAETVRGRIAARVVEGR
ncbi:MAG: hypothetical protein ACREN5_01215, partial [Gemmatimonadales bacterium]